jgi:acyl CoA:acetate/3-ketoacid CoA transferase beta subunit
VHQEGKKVEITGKDKEARERIVRRATAEIKDGMYVNLGIGLPSYCSHFLEAGKNVLF